MGSQCSRCNCQSEANNEIQLNKEALISPTHQRNKKAFEKFENPSAFDYINNAERGYGDKSEGYPLEDDSKGTNHKYFNPDELGELDSDTTDSSRRERRPPYTFKSGAIYEGEWKGSIRDGWGIQTWSDGAKYEGEWRNNKAHGKGKFWHVDGDIFEGQWADDKANGYGIYNHAHGAKYEGQWKDDLQDGYGIETWPDGSKYEGFYKQGKKHGQGTYTWGDGSKYTGNWVDHKITGFGVYTSLDGRRYEGEWLDNAMHGKGVYTWQDGRKYEGEYMNDKKHGEGVYVWADGRRYEGEWAFGKQHGKGKYILTEGTIKIGLWQNGRRVRWLEDENEDGNQAYGSVTQRDYENYCDNYNYTPSHYNFKSNTQPTNLSLSPLTQLCQSQMSASHSAWMPQSAQKELEHGE